MKKYINTKSMTFWAGASMVVIGILRALVDAWAFGGLNAFVLSMTGGMPAIFFLSSGFAVIGGRKKLGEIESKIGGSK